MQASSEAVRDGFNLLTDFKVMPGLTDSRKLRLTWTWKSASLAQQLFQQVKLIHQNDLDLQLLEEHVITDPTVQSYTITNLRPNIHYLVCLRLTRRSTSPNNSAVDPPKNATGYVAEMKCRLAKTQGLHWPAFISCLFGILIALVLFLVLYAFARRWQVKAREKYHQELHHHQQQQHQHHHHHYHSHHQRQASVPGHQVSNCGHKTDQSQAEKGSTQASGESCVKHCTLRVNSADSSKRQFHTTSRHRGATEARDGAAVKDASGCLLTAPSCLPIVVMPSSVDGSGNTPSPGPYSLSGSESYQITSTSSTTEEHVCCHSLETSGQRMVTQQSTGELSEGRHSRKSMGIVQCQPNRRTVSFLVSEKNPLEQDMTVPEIQRHIRPLSVRQSNDAGRSQLKVISPHTSRFSKLPQSPFDFIDSPKETLCPVHREVNTSDLGDFDAVPLAPCSPVITVPQCLSGSTEAPGAVQSSEQGSLDFTVRNGQVESESATPALVFYTQLIETI